MPSPTPKIPPPLEPAALNTEDPRHWRSERFQDGYASRAGALAQAREVFLQGNGLPEAWRERAQFVILETGFGLGNNFLATWQAWRADPQRPRRLFFLSLERYPLQRAELAAAHAGSELAELAGRLVAAWPPLAPGLHRLDFENGAVSLLLALGDISSTLPAFRAEVDAFFLDGFAPDRNPAMWDARTLQTLGRLARPGAGAATWSVARATRNALTQAGFEVQRVPGFGGKAQRLQARFAPRFQPPRPAAHTALAPQAREALVLGAGLAGAACAAALRAEGLAVTVLDAAGAPAQGASGNPGGLFHGSVHADDGPHARWNRAAALRAAQGLQGLPWVQHGLLRLAGDANPAALAELLARQALPADYLQALDAQAVAGLSALPLAQSAWHYPGGGALCPADWVRSRLAGCTLRLGEHAQTLQWQAPHWRVLDEQGREIARTELLVLACGHRLPELLRGLDPELAGLLQPQRGQVSWLDAGAPGPRPRLPVAGGGYVLALPDGRLVCGATSSLDDSDPALREADHQHNLAVWQRLCGVADAGERPLQGRVGWRLLAPDKLPLIGGLPCGAPRHRATQAAHWPRHPGLVVCGALASRGITWAQLAGELAAALALGLPAPVERGLIDAVDPARFAVRKVRQS
ncbi:FAD-dependent 5-carboxymethylaminomethyl-2-thiouridine(34) oxidoreductase MnmC [Inhella sp.]|uniref:FAD-dependent 5-carboxymethylaminomethyl-2-thiouridine(34) oxidoreductase MnmC n=1 Tax=Inhella sp. TaxID=1921806 RepID=UPI0035B237A9